MIVFSGSSLLGVLREECEMEHNESHNQFFVTYITMILVYCKISDFPYNGINESFQFFSC